MRSTVNALKKRLENGATTGSARRNPPISLSVRALIIGGFGALVVILAAVIIGAVIQEQNQKSELAQLDLHSRDAILLQTTEAQAAIAADGVQRYVYNGDAVYMSEINAAAH